MIRPVSSSMVTALNADTLRPAILFSGQFLDGTVRCWSGVGDLTLDGQTYKGIGQFGSVSGVSEGVDVQAYNCQVTLSGCDPTLVSEVLGQYRQGQPVEILIGLFDSTLTLIDTVDAFSGYMDACQITVDGKQASISITIENKLLLMNATVELRLTNEIQQIYHPGDLSLSFVPALQSISLWWGSKPGNVNNG